MQILPGLKYLLSTEGNLFFVLPVQNPLPRIKFGRVVTSVVFRSLL